MNHPCCTAHLFNKFIQFQIFEKLYVSIMAFLDLKLNPLFRKKIEKFYFFIKNNEDKFFDHFEQKY